MFKCDFCDYEGSPTNEISSKEEWGTELSYECPICHTEYCNGIITQESQGVCCIYCGEFTEDGTVKDSDNCDYCKKCSDFAV